jgi:hypothetical protein
VPDLEDIKDALKTVLTSDEFQDGLDGYYQDKPVSMEDRERYVAEAVFTSAKFNPGIYPSIELHGNVSRNAAENDDGPIELLHEVGVFYFYRHDDEEKCNRHVERFFAWLRRYFKDNPYLLNLKTSPITLDDDSYSPFTPEHAYDARPLIQAGTVMLYIKSFD